ncbi:MAG: head-tail connector protein [Alphaproteobacteria bacterium]|nr:head-tail connector protein [Alphaproteobacteria bacterium]
MTMNVYSLADRIIQRTDELKSQRMNFERLWQEVSELVLPRKADFTAVQAQGAKRGRKLFETTAVNAAELLAAGLHGLMTNPAGKWFSLTVTESAKTPEIDKWLIEAEQIIVDEIIRPSAGFSTNIHEVYLDLAVLGTAGLYVGWDEKNNSLLFQSRFLGELFLEENAAGRVDRIYRVFKMPLEKIIQTWGKSAVSENMIAAFEAGTQAQREFEIIHAVFPNDLFENGGAFQKPVSSVYILKDEKTILFSGGFEEMPLFVTRWSKACTEVYGRSPAISVLPDIKMLQEMMKETIIAAQLANRPPLLVRDDDQFSPAATVPGGIIRYTGETPKTFVSGANSSIGLEIMNEIRQRIRAAFYNDRLMNTENVQMSATEVLQRAEEKMRLMGPVFGRLQTELLSPMMTRIFGLLVRHGKLTLPVGVDYRDVRVEYVSPMSLAQKHLQAQAVMRTLELAGGLLQIQPEAAAVFNAPEAIRKIGEMYGVGASLFHREMTEGENA